MPSELTERMNPFPTFSNCDVAFISERIEYLIEIGKIKICEEKTDDNGCYWPRTLSLA